MADALDADRDADGLHPAFSDPDVMAWWNTPLRVDSADTRNDLAESHGLPGAHLWTVREDERPVGLVGLLGAVDVPGLTWLLRRDAWGRGLMTEAAGAVVDYALGPLGLDRVEAWVAVANLQLLKSSLGARISYVVDDPPVIAGVVLGPWSVGPRIRLAAADTPVAPVTVTVDVGTEFASSYRRARELGDHIAAPPVEQPWGMREFVLRLPDGHQLVVTGPA